MNKPRAEISLRLTFNERAPVLDERAIRVLELVDEHGSIMRAAKALGIAYRTAWILIDALNQCGEGLMISANRGGTVNGSRLTKAGQALVQQFRRTERELAAVLDQINRDLSGND